MQRMPQLTGWRACRAVAALTPEDMHDFPDPLDRNLRAIVGFESRRAVTRTTRTAMTQPDAYRMIGRRSAAAGIATKVGNHSFRATGITAYLKNSRSSLEKAAAMANHASTRTTQLYDRRHDEINLDEVERIEI